MRDRTGDAEICDGFFEDEDYFDPDWTAKHAPQPDSDRMIARNASTYELEGVGSVVARMLQQLVADVTDPEYQKCESPIEQLFFRALRVRFSTIAIRTQVPIGRYRVDFLVAGRFVIECDGAQFHGPDRLDYDRQRDHDLRRLGFIVLHFTGRQIVGNVSACVESLAEILRQ